MNKTNNMYLSPNGCPETHKDVLESIIDKTSLLHVLKLISNICSEKADRIRRCHCQDENTAVSWDEAGRRITRYAGATCVQQASE